MKKLIYLLIAVEATSLMRKWLPTKAWRTVHLASFLGFWAATMHAVTAGTPQICHHPLDNDGIGCAVVENVPAVVMAKVGVEPSLQRPVPVVPFREGRTQKLPSDGVEFTGTGLVDRTGSRHPSPSLPYLRHM